MTRRPSRPDRGAILGLAALFCALAAGPAAAADLRDDALWARLQAGGHAVLVRHAAAPGTFDPPGFRLDDCATQRNLSEAGRAEARRLGEVLRARGVEVTEVRSSRWCRARDTATLAFGRNVPWPALDSTVGADAGEVARRVAEVRAAVAAWSGPGTLALVTHQFVISGLTGRSTAEAEVIVLAPAPGGFAVLGALTPAG